LTTYSIIEQQVNTGYAEFILGHSNTPYHTQKEGNIREIYLTKCMSSLTILDYSAIEASSKNIESRLGQKDSQILQLNRELAIMKEKQNEMYQWMEHLENKRIKQIELEQKLPKEVMKPVYEARRKTNPPPWNVTEE
jgi:hypothetical protein